VKNYENLLAEIEKQKKKAEADLDQARKENNAQVTENGKIQDEITGNEKTINRLASEIAQLTTDINCLRNKNEADIAALEKQRTDVNEKAIVQFKAQLAEADHDYAKLKILIQKAQCEMEYLHSEKDKHQSQNYQRRIDDFKGWINDSEKRSLELNEELGRMNSEWHERLVSTVRDTEKKIRDIESTEHAKKISELTHKLEEKSK
jgi:chromosome segregation ATPase